MNEQNISIREKIELIESIFERNYGEPRLEIAYSTLWGHDLHLVPSMAGKKWEIYYFKPDRLPIFVMIDHNLVYKGQGDFDALNTLAEEIELERGLINCRKLFMNHNLGLKSDYATYSFAKKFNLMIRKLGDTYQIKNEISGRDLCKFRFEKNNLVFDSQSDKKSFLTLAKIMAKRQDAIDLEDDLFRKNLAEIFPR